MKNLVPRIIVTQIKRSMGLFPAVGIVGPRQVGKSTLAKQLLFNNDEGVTYLDLERAEHLARLTDATRYLESLAGRIVVIDEIQVRPALFTTLRPLIDDDRRPGRFVLLGSASPELIRGASESLAGRITYHELTPIGLIELPAAKGQQEHWLQGGYPESLFARNPKDSDEWRAAYLETYFTRELPRLGSVAEIDTLRRLFEMLAAQQGQLLNLSGLSRSLGVSQPTVRRYSELLERSYLLRLLRPYHINVRKRLVKAPKIYIRDSGLLHAAMRQVDAEGLRIHPNVGGSYEGYVVEQLAQVVAPRTRIFFYRTQAGAEMDIVLVGRQGRIACVEVKYSSAPKFTKGFYNAREDLGPEQTIVVAPVAESYPLQEGITVMPLSEMLAILKDW